MGANVIDIATMVGALGSAVAAGAAVYIGVLLPKTRQPVLRIDRPSVGTELMLAKTEIAENEFRDSAWVRLRVSAARGKDSATDVEILVLDAREVAPRAALERSVAGAGLSGFRLNWTAGDGPRVHIPAGASRIFDLCQVIRPEQGETANLIIEVSFKPFDNRHVVTWGTIEVDLAVAARNMDTRRFRVRLSYDGLWEPQIWDHLEVCSVQECTES
jgi:hypothetical protein